MLLAPFSRVLRRHFANMAGQSKTPVEDIIRSKARSFHTLSAFNSLTGEQVTEALKPSLLEISNDSAAHSHHRAMEGSTSKETHFRSVVKRSWSTLTSAHKSQSEHSLGCIQIENATRSSSNGLRSAEGRARSTRWYPRPAIEDKNSGRRGQAGFQNWELRANNGLTGRKRCCGRLVQTS
jgi:hypothetical protein